MNTRLLPLTGFVLVFALLGFGIWWSQRHDPREVPSPLIGKPAPQFSLPLLDDPSKKVGSADLAGQPYLLNVFASWCFACGDEHPTLMAYRDKFGVPLIGYDYKDAPQDARAWLQRHGDPYHEVVTDQSGNEVQLKGLLPDGTFAPEGEEATEAEAAEATDEA